MFEKKEKIVTRMAPSPTGNLHIGTARTALYNYLYARKCGGDFIMRSEDTDAKRSTKEFENEILEGLAWLGLEWDTFYRQSERKDIYRSYIDTLLKKDLAYLSREESVSEPGTEVEVVRLRNQNKEIVFTDIVRGEISFDTTELGDIVIARSLDDALYHFVVVVDDFEMGVTHVIRGEDHISNTARQILIQEAIGASRPRYAHLPLLLAADRSKLSKRHGAVSLREYISEGYLPQALTNYLALLGWNPGTDQEIFTLEELVTNFDLSGVQKGGAIFDVEKLKWFNREHLRKFSDSMFQTMAFERLPESLTNAKQFSTERLTRLIPTIRERISVASDIANEAERGEYDFAFIQPKPSKEILTWKNDSSARDALPRLQKLAEIISRIDDTFSVEEIKESIWDYAEEVGKGEVLWPLRVALTGKERSPDPFTVIYIIGSAEAYTRVKNACDTILSA